MSNKKAPHRKGKVQLINGNDMYEKRRKSLGNKRNDIPKHCIDEITKIYGNFRETEVCKIFANDEFGYSKIVVERPLLDEKGMPVLKKGIKQADASLRDTENVPLTEAVEMYFNFTEVKTRNIDFQVKSALQFKMGTIIRKLKTWSDDDIGEIYSNYLVVFPETIMINGLNLEFDFLTQRVAIVKERGIITSAYIAMFPNTTVYRSMLAIFLKHMIFVWRFTL